MAVMFIMLFLLINNHLLPHMFTLSHSPLDIGRLHIQQLILRFKASPVSSVSSSRQNSCSIENSCLSFKLMFVTCLQWIMMVRKVDKVLIFTAKQSHSLDQKLWNSIGYMEYTLWNMILRQWSGVSSNPCCFLLKKKLFLCCFIQSATRTQTWEWVKPLLDTHTWLLHFTAFNDCWDIEQWVWSYLYVITVMLINFVMMCSECSKLKLVLKSLFMTRSGNKYFIAFE